MMYESVTLIRSAALRYIFLLSRTCYILVVYAVSMRQVNS
jgi:hypothetical protein